MIAPCDDLDLFFDGELAADEASRFRDHLAVCERCQRTLLGRAQEAVITYAGVEPQDRRVVCSADDEERRLSLPSEQRAHRGRRLGIGVVASLLAAASLLIWLFMSQGGARDQPAMVELSLEVERRTAMRSTVAHVGDLLRLKARGGAHRAIWVYRGAQNLMVACPGDAQCVVGDTELTMNLFASNAGHYTIIALGAPQPVIQPRGPLDLMLKEAALAGTSIQIKELDIN